ncbi:hypothetical protein BH20ACT15_BH20ACT15_08540 [soil metagenome]
MREPDGYEIALKALSRKERTGAEIEELLRNRGVEEDELRDVLERLAEASGIDDERFAREFAADKRALRGWGPDRIEQALRARGVDGSAIADAVDSETPDEVVDRAVSVLTASGASVEDDAGRGRALALLARRGFPLEAAYDAVRAAEDRSPTL